jgi:putative transposase
MSYIKIWIHAVWATKNREPVLKTEILKQICAHIHSNAKDKGIYIDRINGYDEHIHVLMLLKADNSISKQMQLLKGESAYWANQINLIKNNLEWADKFFAASVSDNKLDNIRAYIDNQQTHHKKQSFLEEYKHFIQSLGYDETDFG